jgi:hypothetical protein
MKKRYYSWMWIVLITSSVYSYAREPGVLTPFADGLISPVVIANAGDSRLFVANEPGSISLVDSAGNVKPEFFLDITNKVIFGGEQGLLMWDRMHWKQS